MPKIPKVLRKDDFRFIKVKNGKKIPIEKNWQNKNNYRYDDLELVHHIDNNGNYGVVCGYGNLVVIDCDSIVVEDIVEKELPDTLKVKTGSGGSHFYYRSDDIEEPIRLSSGDAQGDVGDVQYKGKQVIGPTSVHPNGNEYSIENNGGISEISVVDIREALRKYITNDVKKVKEEERKLRDEHDDDFDISITDVVDISDLERKGSELQGPHPVHGSSNGNNFCVNTSEDIWHCFRHDTGGGPLSWIAVESGLISCEEAVKGALRGDKFKEVLEVAKEDYGIEIYDESNKDLSDDFMNELKDKIFDFNRKSWNCSTEFVTFTKELKFGDGKKVKFPDTYELPKDIAQKLIDKKIASKGIWKCDKCGKFLYQEDRPYSCKNSDCDSSKFDPLHPQSFDEIGDCLLDNYHFAVPEESMTERKAGRVHIYVNGVYHYQRTKGFIRNKVKKINHLSKQGDQSHVIDHIATIKLKPSDEFGLEGPRIVLRDGILNLDTLEMEDHDPDALALSRIDVYFNPGAECPKFKKYLKEVIPDKKDRVRLKEFLGTALVNEKMHKKAVILVGPTDAGKSTFVNIMSSIFGDMNTSHQGPTVLSNTRWGKAKLRGKLLNTTDEVSANKLRNLAILKKILDGNKIEAERKGEKTFEFAPYCEHIFCANQTPSADRKDDAFWNRWIPIEIPNKISRRKMDPNLTDKILKEREGIFKWIVDGYRKFIKNGKEFTYPLEWKESRDKWLKWGKSIPRFIQQCIEKEEGNRITSKELHRIYSKFAQEHNLDVEGQKKLTSEVKKISYANYSSSYWFDGDKKRGFKNIKVKDPKDTDKIVSYGRKKTSKAKNSNSKIDEFEKDRVNRVQEETLRDMIINSLKERPKKVSELLSLSRRSEYSIKDINNELVFMKELGLIFRRDSDNKIELA